MKKCAGGRPDKVGKSRQKRLSFDITSMKYYTYIIQSQKDGRYYIGYAVDPEIRLQRHNDGWSRSTKGYIPWKLVHTEEHESKTKALARERQLKSWKSHKVIEDLICCHAEGRPDKVGKSRRPRFGLNTLSIIQYIKIRADSILTLAKLE
jgi:putative endonuclease